MSYITDHRAKFDNLKVCLELKNRDQLRRTANGGNSILFAYESKDEILYLAKAEKLLPEAEFEFIDIAKLLVEFIDSFHDWSDFKEYYNEFAVTPHIIFKSEDSGVDLMDLIIRDIKRADENNKIPVLIRTGSLYGTGIENVNIMEHPAVMGLKQPLVLFYPSHINNDQLYFLNFKLASKYRCTVIE